jgi:hypothetical protein
MAMNNTMTKATRIIAGAVFAFAATGTVFALPTLTISAPVSAGHMTCAGVISAGICTDTFVGAGTSVSFVGSIGNWNLNFTDHGLDNSSGPQYPNLDLEGGGSSNVNAPGSLTIVFSQTGFSTGGGSTELFSAVGGTDMRTQTNFAVATVPSTSTTGLGYSTAGNNAGPGNAPATSYANDSAGVIVSPGVNYAIKLVAVVNPDGTSTPHTASFNFALTGNPTVPEPAFYSLTGIGLVGLLFTLNRRRKNQTAVE